MEEEQRVVKNLKGWWFKSCSGVCSCVLGQDSLPLLPFMYLTYCSERLLVADWQPPFNRSAQGCDCCVYK